MSIKRAFALLPKIKLGADKIGLRVGLVFFSCVAKWYICYAYIILEHH